MVKEDKRRELIQYLRWGDTVRRDGAGENQNACGLGSIL